jgi:CheY-like chemotaxis protein
MRIAYIEDNVTNIALIERICNMGKDELVTYLDAETALSEIEPGAIDLIIVDLHLGNSSMNGLELTQHLRNKGVGEPIIAITSYDNLYLGMHKDAGCDEYVRKPVSVPQMVELINLYRRSA